VAVVVTLLTVGCTRHGDPEQRSEPAGGPIDVAAAGPEVRAALAQADEAIADLQRTLQERLITAMAEGGPPAAVTVCRDEAQALTRSIGEQRGLALGRTSHRVRNVVNAPRAWAVDVVDAHAGRAAVEVEAQTFDLGGRIGVLKPIGTQPLCVTCHGPAETVRAAIGDALASSYPDDRAVGFEAGELRGWFWAEVPVAAAP
jgi:hypothetical protein